MYKTNVNKPQRSLKPTGLSNLRLFLLCFDCETNFRNRVCACMKTSMAPQLAKIALCTQFLQKTLTIFERSARRIYMKY